MSTTLYLSPDLDSTRQHAIERAHRLRQTAPLSPIYWLLPTRRAVQATRHELGDSLGNHFFEFYSLAQAILDATGLPPHRLSDWAVRRLVRQLLGHMQAQGELSSFQTVWELPGFQQVVIDWLREMKSQGITPEAVLAHISSTQPQRDEQLGLLFSRYQAFLQAAGFSDADGLLWLAAEALEGKTPWQPPPGLCLVLGFDQFNPLQVRILAELGDRLPELAIYLDWDAGRPVESLALTRLAHTRQGLQAALAPQVVSLPSSSEGAVPALSYLSRRLFSAPGGDESGPPAGQAIQAVSAPSREAEVRWALKHIKRLLLQGVAPDDIALLVPQPGSYMSLVTAVAEEYGLPVLLEEPLNANPAIAALLNLLSLFPEFPRRQTLEALRSPYFRQGWLSAAQVEQLDQLSRERPVIGGTDQWRAALRPLPRLTGSEEGDEDRGIPLLASRLDEAELEAIRAGLQAFWAQLSPPEQAGWRQYDSWLQSAILGLVPAAESESLEALVEGNDRPLAQQGPSTQPPWMGLYAACREGPYARRDLAALQQLVHLLRSLVQAVELVEADGAAPLTWEDFRAELFSSLQALSVPLEANQPGVLFAALEEARALRVGHLLVAGLAEGEFPQAPPPEVLYAPAERAQHPLPLARPLPGEEASLWWQVLNSSRRSLALLRPRLDANGAPWLASPYWERALEHFPDVEEIEIPVAELPDPQQAASVSELLVALAVQGAQQIPAELASTWSQVQQAYRVAHLRAGWTPIPAFEGQLQAADLRAELAQRFGPGHIWSASRLNQYGTCPYGFYAQNVLQLEALPDPQEGLDAMQRGSLLHAILEALYRQLVAEGLAPSLKNQPEVLRRLAATCTGQFAHAPQRYGFRPGPLWDHEQAELHRLLDSLLRWECAQNGDDPAFLPYQQELGFGMTAGGLPRLQLEDETGARFSLHGVIDRIDRAADGRLRVIDYKSGSRPYSENDIRSGLALQTPLYALAVEELVAKGAPLAESFYLHIPSRKASGKLTFSGPVAIDETVLAAVEQVGSFVRRVQAGDFPSLPARPVTGSNACRVNCEFAGLCRVDRHTRLKASRAGGAA